MLCHYNCIDFSTSKNNNEPIVQSCNFCSKKNSNKKLRKNMKTVDYLFIAYMAALFVFCVWGKEIHDSWVKTMKNEE